MDKKVVGFAIMFLSLILLLGFSFMGWDYIGDLALSWQMVWMLTAIGGFILVILSQKKGK